MRLLRTCIVFWFALFVSAQDVQIQILSTTDMHGHIMPNDIFSLAPSQEGWGKIATLIKEAKKNNPNTLLLDAGDTIQGHPVNYVRSFLRRDLPEPSVNIMNGLGFHAMAVGNHEFNYGIDYLRSVEQQAAFPFLAANILNVSSGQPAFKTYTVTRVGSIKVVTVGLITSWVPKWDLPSQYRGLKFEDAVQVAKVLIPKIQAEEKPDVLVILIHSGLGEKTGSIGDENVIYRLLDQVEGINAVVSGHTHQPLSFQYNNVPIIQAYAHGKALGKIIITLQSRTSGWRIVKSEPTLIFPTETTIVDEEVLKKTADLRAATDRYLDTPATNILSDLDARFMRIESTPLINMIHQVQQESTGSQLSAAAAVNPNIFIPKGMTSVRQFYALNPYEDRLARIRLTGAQVKLWLEHAASMYNFSYQSTLFKSQVYFYNIDSIGGVTYTIDLMSAPGNRIRDLQYQNNPMNPKASFTLAITTYRLNGGGGYIDAVGFKGWAEYITDQLQRNLMLRYVLSGPTLNLSNQTPWRTNPPIDRTRLWP